VPPLAKPGRAARIARLGKRVYSTKITVRSDPRGHKYFWLTGKEATGIALPGSDVEVINDHQISVTPIHLDCTDFTTLTILKRWDL
jgi:5'-nucleotidase